MTVGSQYGPKHVCCDLWSYEGRPLVNQATHRARIAAHDALDPLWKDGHISRTEAYRLLARVMKMPREKCHIGDMNLEQLYDLPHAVEHIKMMLHVLPNATQQQEAHLED